MNFPPPPPGAEFQVTEEVGYVDNSAPYGQAVVETTETTTVDPVTGDVIVTTTETVYE